MLTKFETKSNRVKGLSFHSKRPWILASLHSGVIQLWDYRMGTLIDRFDEHDGPVRGVHFHKSQPLFVSGGDDYKIKVWNYKLHRCLFTLLGHLDYIRTVQFHHESPWIVSSSDDQTIRIWNWQSRTCISVLTGHNHYVMCALFHPKEDLVVSASLDQTVRVWDIGALRKKSVSPADDILRLSQMNTDFFGGVDAVVKYVLEGHDRGVNWASFHPTLPLIVSGADDRQVKIWRMNDSKAWEVDTLRGHMNNVSSVLFHSRQDIIVSNSEDKSIRVWDATKRTGLQTFRREHDRFWILGCHPEINLLAAGHDSGMIVFKLERERPAFSVSGDSLYYVKDRFLRFYEYSSQKEAQIIPIRRPGSASFNQGPRTLSYSPTENAVLICSDVDGGSYELYIVPKDSFSRGDTVQEAKRGIGGSAVFVARNRFAVLEKSTNQVLVKNLKNEIVKKSALPVVTDAIFYAGTGNLLCRAEDRVVIFDLQQRMVLGDLQTSLIRYVVWSNDMENVALLSKHSIIIADKRLVHRCTLHETIRVKSGSWDENGVFIYTTLTHIKYCLPNGDCGIIRTLDVPVYITKIIGNTICCLDRDGKNRAVVVDSTEYLFKLSLLKKRYDHVMSMIRNSELCGQAMIAYLQQKGFPEVALHFVKDERTRFNLALESGNIQIAVASAKEIDEKDHWYRLGVEALRQGNTGIVEYAYQRTKNFERLSFLYLITGNLDKLSKMMKIAEVKDDVMGQFHNALYLGDVKERIKILENAGHLPLALATAKTHGLNDIAEGLAAKLEGDVPSLPSSRSTSLLIPPTPVLCGGDWPLLRVMKGIFEGGLDNVGRGAQEEYEDAADADWGDDLDIVDVENIQNGDINMVLEDEEAHEENEEGGWDLEDLELPPDTETLKIATTARTSEFVAPTPGMPVSQIWVQKSSLAAEHAAAGNFDTAMRLLNRQLGIKNFAPLKSLFIDLHMGSHTYLRAFSSAPLISLAIERGWSESASPNVRSPPALVFNFSQLEDKLKAGYKATTVGKFTEALRLFMGILHTIPLIVVESWREVDEVKELVIIVKEYVLGLQMELKRREFKDNPVRQQELAAYFTHCNLQLPHLRLALVNAMTVCYKAGNLITASSFARRLLETNPAAENQAQKARSVLQAAERNMKDSTQLNYDFRNPFVTCGATYVPIYRGQKDVLCPYCSSHFVLSQEGQLCAVCNLAVVGSDASGLLCSPAQIR
ncbi:coatomer subunit alpha-1-like [Cynara cardunculus var. scolymus]|uniref:coatomer subunit alpha-1-like n=1 Tax=Cynara cardunculus var. scolymus TaxID=59895 RepID=UPI000D626A13|nr:coatomer subunit alpha-1-like [Cynara cardunculus var. scolymus]XP_024970081.1 coatomer subunit alpha-1-like [Cynara cardunculus var. scolymus]XP_024970082.1 coatomer subunit alpha-1-like [Cynara cardunculus var. scolymus]